MDDAKTLADYNVQPHATLHLRVRALGGGGGASKRRGAEPEAAAAPQAPTAGQGDGATSDSGAASMAAQAEALFVAIARSEVIRSLKSAAPCIATTSVLSTRSGTLALS